MAKKQHSIKPASPSELSQIAEEHQYKQNPGTQDSALELSTTVISDVSPVILSDIIEQQQTENELHRLTRTLRATNQCNQALIHSTNEIELLQSICDIVVDVGGYRMAWIGYAEHDKEKSVRPIAQSGFEDGYLETANISWDDTEFGRGPTGSAIRTGKPITSRDILNDPFLKPWRNDAFKRGYASSQSLPLKTGHEIFGALTIYATHPNAFNAEETKLHTTLAENLAYGITMLRTRQEHKKVQEELSASNDRMHLIMKATNAGFWEHEISTNTNTWSDEVWKLYGLKPIKTDNTYDTWISTIITEDREAVEQAVQEALNTGGEYSCTWRTINSEGQLRWLLSKGSPIKNSKGTILRYAGIVLDITDQKKKEDALKESENRFRALFEEHVSVMLIIDPETGNIIDANRAAADFYGWPVETLKQKQLHQLSMNPPEYVKRQMEKFNKAEQNHRSFSHRLANGSIRDVDVFSCPITFHGKALLYSIINDITERKRAEQALLSSEKKFRSITEQLAEMVFVTDSRGSLTYVSPASEQLFGYLPHEMIGHTFTEYMEDEDISRGLGLFRETLLHNLSTKIIEWKCIKKNGSFFYGEVHFQYYQENASSGTIGLIHDITERKQQEIFHEQYEHELQKSQQFLASIYDEVNHSIFVVDVRDDGGFRFKGINPVHEKLTGIKNEDIIGKTPEEFLDPEVAETVTHNYAACIREGKTIQYEEALPFQGKITWWETVLNPVRDNAGHIYRLIGTSKNITERKQAYAQLSKMSAAVEQSPAVVVITDPRGNIEYVNPMFTKHTGYSAEEAIGKNLRLLQSGLVRKALYKELWQTILSGKVWRGELQNKKKNGELYWESVVIAAIVNTKGLITNVVAVKENITEQKKMLDELIASKEKAEESDRLKSAFLANISHEIRTPMNGILGFSELLKEPQLSGEEMAEYIDLIQKSGQRMLNLINDLIDISRIDAQETKLQVTKTPLNDLLHDLHAFFKPEAETKGLRFTCTTGLSDSESIITTDSVKLNQILTNLVKNALKFTRKGGVDFGYTRKDGTLEFYVIDSGIGIPDEMKEKVFDRFRQVDNTLTRGYEGAGLGLSITKAFVEILGGTIWVESVEDAGSTFFFTLPYNPQNPAFTTQH